MSKIICLPVTNEFGGELLKNVYHVNGIDGHKVVCHEKGKECLYPGADERFYVEKDATIEDIMVKYGRDLTIIPIDAVSYCEKIKPFIPEVKNYGFTTDVVVFPRNKANNGAMNWGGWKELIDKLQSNGIRVFAAGHPDYSSHFNKCESAWDYDNYLEATIHAIKNSRIRIGLITGLSVLSLMCGKDVWVLTAPSGNKSLLANIGPNVGYLHWADHTKAGWRLVPHLDNINHISYEIKREKYESF